MIARTLCLRSAGDILTAGRQFCDFMCKAKAAILYLKENTAGEPFTVGCDDYLRCGFFAGSWNEIVVAERATVSSPQQRGGRQLLCDPRACPVF